MRDWNAAGATRRTLLTVGGLITAGAVAGCTAPASTSGKSRKTSPASVATTLPKKAITLDLYLENQDSSAFEALRQAFTKQHPMVGFKVRSDAFQNLAQNAAKIISGPEAPDLFRYPPVATAAKNGLLTNLDPYAKAYGWDAWPQATMSQLRVRPDGSRGDGSLYALGVGYSTTGIYYNKALAARVGITLPLATLSDLEEALAKAKRAGVLPIMVGNKAFTVAYPLQCVQNQLEDVDKLKAWIYQQPKASYDTPSAVAAAQKIQDWAKAGYFPEDINALDYTTMVSRFIGGDGLFLFDGNWEAGNLDRNASGKFGFFLMPGRTATSRHIAMAAPRTYVIPSSARQKDAAAYFLNWLHTDRTARQIQLDTTGFSPGGPANLPAPTAASGSIVAETLAAADQLTREDGTIDFIGNATAGILTSAIGPKSQLLVAGRMSPREFVSSIQAAYVEELGR